ncbi:serine palmitoyltransferase small subunit A [Drosophila bipectinata]|uniref:serine palmitoyltransferase small subunit A n=1 Tax=Drosophila bipectinata TaxID=42026 RepID=UPI001C8A9E5C|nr:serine palmitoyltransferase small subunit B [Drosophila bipectinata]
MFNFKELASHAYRQYELVTCINMLEPWERKLINGFFLIMMTLVIFSSCVYLPNYLQNLMQFVTPPAWLNPGENVAYVAQKMARS